MVTEGTNLETNFGDLNPLQILLLYNKEIVTNSSFQFSIIYALVIRVDFMFKLSS